MGDKAGLIDFRDLPVYRPRQGVSLEKERKIPRRSHCIRNDAIDNEKWGDFVVNGRIFTSLVYIWCLIPAVLTKQNST